VSIPTKAHPPYGQYLLAIESTCDETAAAVVDSELHVRSNVVASQTDLHERYGGVVPEIASRAHVQRILPVIDEALERAGISLSQISAVAVTSEPGLVGSLLVGLTAAKTLALVLDVPLVAVNHIEAHIYACRLVANRDVFPAIGFVVSGGHTNLYDCPTSLDFELLGSTIDDAAGEAFDKVAQILSLSYPGGPAIERAAACGDAAAFKFPRTFLNEARLDFSFSGLKTAVLYTVRGIPGAHRSVPPMNAQRIADVAASFQSAVIDVLVGKCEQTLRQTGRKRLCVGGGVAANSLFRRRLAEMAESIRAELIVAPLQYCTDNAAMAAMAWELLTHGRTSQLDLDVNPGLVRKRRFRRSGN